MALEDSNDAGLFQSMAKLTTADALVKKFNSMKTARLRREGQWKLNLAFYRGQQYSFWNSATRRIETVPVGDGDKPRFRVRLVSNQILPGSTFLLSQFTKTKPQMYATPGSGDDASLKAAQMAEAALEYWWNDFNLDDKLAEALLWSIIASQGYWEIAWDPQAGKQMQFLLDPNGQPVVDESLKALYRQELQQAHPQLADAMTKTVYMGDISVRTISPFDLYVDPGVKTYSEARFVIKRSAMDPDEIKARFNVDVQPDAQPSPLDSALILSGSQTEVRRTLRNVYYGYFLPGPTIPKGRMVVWIENPNQILKDGPWPYPINKLPFIKFGGIRVPGDVYDSSVVEHAIPLQKEYNRTISQIVEYKNLMVKPQIFAPVGSLRQRLTNEPGAVFEYSPVAGLKPEPMQTPNLPPYVFEHLANVKSRIDEIFNRNTLQEGKPPPNVEAGVAIDLLQEMAADTMAPTINLMEKALGDAGEYMIALAQKYYEEPRLLKIKGSGGSVQVKEFTRSDLVGNISVHVEAGSGLPRSRAGKQAYIMELVKMQVIPPDRAMKYLDVADAQGLRAQMQADEDQALREHDRLINNQVLNQNAVQAAMEQLQESGGQVNPETGQPWQDQDDLQEWLTSQSLQPFIFEDYGTHLDVHGQFMKSVEYEMLPDDAKKRFIDHFTATMTAKFNLPRLPDKVNSPNVNLQIKATAGPTATAEILNRAGVREVTPDQLREPPLETWVSDAIDKDPNGMAGNDPISMMKGQAEIEQIQAQTQAAQGQADPNSNENQVALAQQLQSMQHEAQTHHQKMTHADQMHQQRMKNAAKPQGSNNKN